MSADLSKLKVAELKARCKAAGVAGTGEKPDLVARLKQVARGEAFKAAFNGVNPAALKAGALKKELATRGLPCSLDLESRDVLVERLVEALDGEGGGAGATEGRPAEEEAIVLAVEVARQVVELAGDAASILSLLGTPITTSSPFAQQRKAYLSLSRMIHPDKLSRHFDGATRAFQELVRAFDELTAPPPSEAAPSKSGSKANAGPSLSRSNANCFRTRVYCPRCSSEWATQDSGVEKYDYNLMMQGLKLYCCALCLCEFGCVSATHRCPLCAGPFAYHPNDFHRQIACGNPRCKGTFGFMLYTVPARVEAELRVALKAEQERRMKAREATLARLARAQRKQPALPETDGAKLKHAEKCFMRGLLDACPRCGWEGPPGVKHDELQAHLAGCTDKRAHEAYRRGVAAKAAVAAQKAAKRDAEEEAQTVAAWQYLGGQTEQMWMLTDKALAKQCEEKGLLLLEGGTGSSDAKDLAGTHGGGGADALAPGTSREEMLAALAKHEQFAHETAGGTLRIADGSRAAKRAKGGSASGNSATARPRLSADSLPSNLHSLSLSQLRSVCASHGMVVRGQTTADVIADIETALYEGTEAAPLLLE